MADLFSLERVHESRIEMLVEMFGSEDVKEFYNEERKNLEQDATIETFIPMLAYRRVKEKMMEN